MPFVGDPTGYGTCPPNGTATSFVIGPRKYQWIRAPRIPKGSGGVRQDGLDALELEFGIQNETQLADLMARYQLAISSYDGIIELRYWDSPLASWVQRPCTVSPPEEEAYGQVFLTVRWRFNNIGLPISI